MKIVISAKNSSHPKVQGLAQALATDHQVGYWAVEESPLVDMITRQSPDLFIADDEDKTVEYLIDDEDFKSTKIVTLNTKKKRLENHSGLIINLEEFTGMTMTDLFVPYSSNDFLAGGEPTRQYMADITVFTDGMEDVKFSEWISALACKYTVKAYGSHQPSLIEYLGSPDTEDYKKILASGRVGIAFDERWLPDISRAGMIPLLYTLAPSTHWEFSTYKELAEACSHVTNPEFYTYLWAEGLRDKYEKETYGKIAKSILERIFE